ncbi:MAG: ABC-2 transporter permease [Lachnospiraceae bacterium]|nr:ABC-2 transporter permease [Lachnospiraceae bacterium]
MKGLLIKDFYLMKKYCKILFLFVICFLVAGVIKKDPFFHTYSMLMVSIIPVTLLSYDEKSKWNVYSQTMPYSKKQIVSEKYLVMLALLCIVSVLMCINQYFITKTELSSDIWYYYTLQLQAVMMIFSVCMIMSSVLLSVLFKFGIEKGRIIYYILFLLAAIAANSIVTSDINEVLPMFIREHILLTVFAADILLLGISWWTAIRSYEKREI